MGKMKKLTSVLLIIAMVFTFSLPITAEVVKNEIMSISIDDILTSFPMEAIDVLTADVENYDVEIEGIHELEMVSSGIATDSQSNSIQSFSASSCSVVANLGYMYANPSTLHNGQPTTATEFYWFWTYGGTNFTYCTQGHSIVGLSVGGFPQSYVTGNLNGGFVTQFKNPGTHDFIYIAVCSAGSENFLYLPIDILPVGGHQTINGNLPVSTAVDTYQINVNSANSNSIGFVLHRRGNTGVRAEIFNDNNVLVDIISISGGTSVSTSTKWSDWKIINKSVSGDYTVKVSVFDNYSSMSNSYSLMYGRSDNILTMLSSIDNNISIQRYNNTNPIGVVLNNAYNLKYIPREQELYFKFTGAANTSVTLLSNHPFLRFKIVDENHLTTLYDSNTDTNATRTSYINNWQGCQVATFNMNPGQVYYLVAYVPTAHQNHFTIQQSLERELRLFIGDRPTMIDSVTVMAMNSIVATSAALNNSSPIMVFDVGTNIPNTATLWRANFSDFPWSVSVGVNSMRLNRPNSSTWYTDSLIDSSRIDMPYALNSSANVPAYRYFQVQVQTRPNYTNSTLRLTGRFHYFYFMGD